MKIEIIFENKQYYIRPFFDNLLIVNMRNYQWTIDISRPYHDQDSAWIINNLDHFKPLPKYKAIPKEIFDFLIKMDCKKDRVIFDFDKILK